MSEFVFRVSYSLNSMLNTYRWLLFTCPCSEPYTWSHKGRGLCRAWKLSSSQVGMVRRWWVVGAGTGTGLVSRLQVASASMVTMLLLSTSFSLKVSPSGFILQSVIWMLSTSCGLGTDLKLKGRTGKVSRLSSFYIVFFKTCCPVTMTLLMTSIKLHAEFYDCHVNW